MSNLKEKTTSGMKWSVIERFSVQGIQLLLGLFIARILVPEDYGLIGMLSIFIAVSQLFIDSGFSAALIHKIDRTETDFSTVFYFSIVVSLFFYGTLALSAGFIADFFKIPELEILTRVVALNFVINSLAIIQRTKLTIALDFKTQAKASLAATFISGLIGLILAFQGFGVWALVWQMLASSSICVILLLILKPWIPLFVFSRYSFKTMFGFSSRLLIAGLIETIYNNVYQLIIGKLFSATVLGYYTRAQQFAIFSSSNIAGVVQRVTFPILSEVQNDNERLRRFLCRFLRMTVFVVFPLTFGLALLARPLIICILTEKWAGAIPLLQLLCFSFMFYPIHALNLNLLQVKGRTDLYLKVEFLKKIIITIALIITIPQGIEAMCIGMILTSLISLVINTYYTGILIKFGFWEQLKELFPILAMTIAMTIVVGIVTFFLENELLKLLIGITTGFFSYIGMAYLFRFKEIQEIFDYICVRKQQEMP